MIHPRMFSPYKCSYYHPKKDLIKFDHMPKGHGEPITTLVCSYFLRRLLVAKLSSKNVKFELQNVD
jgi:hypothetical protein